LFIILLKNEKIVSAILIIILLIYLNYWVKYGESSNTFEYIIAISSKL